MSDTLIIGIITGTVALLSVSLNIFWMGKTFDHLSTAINQTRESVKDLAARIDKQFDRVDKQFERIDKRFEAIESDLKQFYRLLSDQATTLQSLRDRNPDLK